MTPQVFKLAAINIDKLFIEALRRDLRRIEIGQPSTTQVKRESSLEALTHAHQLLNLQGTAEDLDVNSKSFIRHTSTPQALSRTMKTKRKKSSNSDQDSDDDTWDEESLESDDEAELECTIDGCTKTFITLRDLRK